MKKEQLLDLKTYIEKIEDYCWEKTKNELIDIVCNLSKEVSVADRVDFLWKITWDVNEVSNEVKNTSIEDTLNEIQILKEILLERLEKMENWELYDEYDDRYNYDEEQILLLDEYIDEIKWYFEEANKYFLSWDFQKSRQIYEELIWWFRKWNSLGDLEYEINSIDINWKETRARYCRSVYETLSENIQEILIPLELEANIFQYEYDPNNIDYPSLKDIYNSYPWKIKNWDTFLNNLKPLLKNEVANRSIQLYLEAINETWGIENVDKEVKNNKSSIWYLFLITELINKNDYIESEKIVKQALSFMKNWDLREQTAYLLSLIGEKNNCKEDVLLGKREMFKSVVNDINFAIFLNEIIIQNIRDFELEKILEYLNQIKDEDNDYLKIKIFFMLKNISDAIKIIKNKNSSSRSYLLEKSQSLLAYCILMALIKSNINAWIINNSLRGCCNISTASHKSINYELGNKDIIFYEISKSLSDIDIPSNEKQEFFECAEKIIKEDIEGIVSNKKRKQYNKASLLLWALMEAYIINNEESKAKEIYNYYRNEKFRQYSSFRKEVDITMKNFALLKSFI